MVKVIEVYKDGLETLIVSGRTKAAKCWIKPTEGTAFVRITPTGHKRRFLNFDAAMDAAIIYCKRKDRGGK